MQRRLIVAVAVVGLFAALLVTSVATAGKPGSQVRGQGKVQIGDPALISVSHVSVNAWEDGAGVARGSLEWVGGVGPDTVPPAYPWHMKVTSIDVSGNTAEVCWVVVKASNPLDLGIEDCFVFTDAAPDTINLPSNVTNTGGAIQAGNIIVR